MYLSRDVRFWVQTVSDIWGLMVPMVATLSPVE